MFGQFALLFGAFLAPDWSAKADAPLFGALSNRLLRRGGHFSRRLFGGLSAVFLSFSLRSFRLLGDWLFYRCLLADLLAVFFGFVQRQGYPLNVGFCFG